MNKNYLKSKQYSVAMDILSLCMTIALLVYLMLGFYVGVWHPTWLVFVASIVISILSYFVCYFNYMKNPIEDDDILSFDKQFEHSLIYSKTVKISGILFIIALVCYVIISSFVGAWHPLWLIFILMAVIEQSIALVYKLKYKVFKYRLEQKEIEDVKSEK